MDIQRLTGEAEQLLQEAGGAQAVPGVAQAAGVVHGIVGEAKAKADAAGLGGVFIVAEHMAEQKLNVDLDGDGDKGNV